MEELPHTMVVGETGFNLEQEKHCGILHYANEWRPGFSGILKQRYTDFIVNEIALDGTVVHFTSDKAPKFKAVAKNNNASGLPSTQASAAASAASGAVDKNTNELSPTPAAELKADSKPDVAQQPASKDGSPQNAGTTFVIDPRDAETLVKYFNAELKDDLLKFQDKILAHPLKKPATFGSLLSSPITDRVLRGRIHQDIRRIFNSKIETTLIDGDVIKFTAAPPLAPHPEGYSRRQQARPNNPKGKLGWQELGGEYLHFSLYKENKNTLDVTSFLSRRLAVKPKEFGFAGTKDRRAATVQRLSIKRQHADKLASLNRELRNARVGDFKYEKHGLQLGDLQGNEFTITLRDCRFKEDSGLDIAARAELAQTTVSKTVDGLKTGGFINYFGLQRFGTFETSTDEVGKKILMGDFEGAVQDILSFNEEALFGQPDPNARGSDKVATDMIFRARAINTFKKTGKYQGLPPSFNTEQSVIRHLSSNQKSTDYLGAIMAITRNMRSLYPHAYQSLVWNHAASERWRRHGDSVIEGDLVLIDTETQKAEARQTEVDASGEVIVHPAEDDVGLSYEDVFQRARPLTKKEASSGSYTIFDIVLPTPGFDVEYPNNDIGDFYKDFMGSQRGGGLDPANMRRAQKEFSLSGSYRKLMGKVGEDLVFGVRTYNYDTEQLVLTDLDQLHKARSNPSNSFSGRDQGRRHDNNAGLSGWRQNDNHSSQQGGPQPKNDNAQQLSPAGDPSSTQPAEAAPAIHPGLAAWQSLPAQLAAEDEAAAAAAEAEKLAGKNIDPDSIMQPIYKETFVETSLVDNEGRRTGRRSTKYIGADGKEVTKEEAEAINEANSKLAAKAAANASPSGSSSDKQPATSWPATTQASQESNKQPAASQVAVAPNQSSQWSGKEQAGDAHDPAEASSSVPWSAAPGGPVEEEPTKIAVVIKFRLGSSMYATMALRELMKSGVFGGD